MLTIKVDRNDTTTATFERTRLRFMQPTKNLAYLVTTTSNNTDCIVQRNITALTLFMLIALNVNTDDVIIVFTRLALSNARVWILPVSSRCFEME